MAPDDDTTDPDVTELDAVADRVADRLDDQPASETTDQPATSGVSLTRRQLLTIAGGGSAAVAALMALGVDRASAQQAAGQVGTSSDPVDVFASDVDVAGSLSAGDLDADGSGRIGGDIKFGAELLRTTAPKNTTDVFDTVGALDAHNYSLVTVTSDTAGLDSDFSARGFVGLFYLDLDGNGAVANLDEIATVAAYGPRHTASLDTSTGEITYGTTAGIAERADIVVSALRMG